MPQKRQKLQVIGGQRLAQQPTLTGITNASGGNLYPKRNMNFSRKRFPAPSSIALPAKLVSTHSPGEPKLQNLFDLLLHELGYLAVGLKVTEVEAKLIGAPEKMHAMRPVLGLMARLSKLHGRKIDTIVAENDLRLPGSNASGIVGMWSEAQRRRDQSEYDCVVRTGVINVLRRANRTMEAACESAAESANLLGWLELGVHLTNCARDWRLLDALLRKESSQAAAQAYVADADPNRPRQGSATWSAAQT